MNQTQLTDLPSPAKRRQKMAREADGEVKLNPANPANLEVVETPAPDPLIADLTRKCQALEQEAEVLRKQLHEARTATENIKQSRQLLEASLLEMQRQRDAAISTLNAASRDNEALTVKNQELSQAARNLDGRVRQVELRERAVAEKEQRPVTNGAPPKPDAQLEYLKDELRFLRELCLANAKGRAS